jgi:glycosyltransferase involved in cell wall biosynthesis
MRFHILLSRANQLAQQAEQASLGKAPRHAVWLLSNTLNASIHEPSQLPAKGLDKFRARVMPTGDLWSLARNVRAIARPSDVIFCPSEAGGLQLGAVYGANEARPRIAVVVHNVDRPRARLAMKLWRIDRKVDLFLAVSDSQVDFLRRYLNLSSDRVRLIWDHTDTKFFSPGPATAKLRPLIVSVGLEQRDYKTLAAATCDLDVEVRISGYSKDAAAMSRTFPKELPHNMSRRFYEWTELLQLYRDADIVVVSCHENKYAAGVQSLMEAMACNKPVIATTTAGLKGNFSESILGVRPGNPSEMREAIVGLLNDSPGAETRALAGRTLALKRYSIDRYVSEVETILRSMG